MGILDELIFYCKMEKPGGAKPFLEKADAERLISWNGICRKPCRILM